MERRLFDICIASLMLLFFSPFFLICLIAVKLSSPGPIFYSHPRIGLMGKSFGCLKFRTMYRDSERKLQPLLAANPALLHEWNTFFKLKTDPRITPVGNLLRKTSLDELPQIWNVIRGEMSIVGPRPLTEKEVTDYLKDKASIILSVRPGLTALWVTQGRNRLSLEERVALEEYYVKNRTFLLDCKVILQTALLLFNPKGAY
jgi:lipopolysaccharide/colanic/teichoic acid biosynthesis glycosyltransferase